MSAPTVPRKPTTTTTVEPLPLQKGFSAMRPNSVQPSILVPTTVTTTTAPASAAAIDISPSITPMGKYPTPLLGRWAEQPVENAFVSAVAEEEEAVEEEENRSDTSIADRTTTTANNSHTASKKESSVSSSSSTNDEKVQHQSLPTHNLGNINNGNQHWVHGVYPPVAPPPGYHDLHFWNPAAPPQHLEEEESHMMMTTMNANGMRQQQNATQRYTTTTMNNTTTTRFTPPPPPPRSLLSNKISDSDDVIELKRFLATRWYSKIQNWLDGNPRDRPVAPCPNPSAFLTSDTTTNSTKSSAVDTLLDKLEAWYKANFGERSLNCGKRRTVAQGEHETQENSLAAEGQRRNYNKHYNNSRKTQHPLHHSGASTRAILPPYNHHQQQPVPANFLATAMGPSYQCPSEYQWQQQQQQHRASSSQHRAAATFYQHQPYFPCYQ